MSSNKFWFPILATVMFLGCFSARAQSTFGSVLGTVKDASGAAIGGAQVTLTSTGTGAQQTFTTDQNGSYSFVNVSPGEYSVDVDRTGFKRFKLAAIDVQVQQSARIDATLEIGADTQTVEVTAQTPLLQTDNASLGQVIDERKTNETPLNGRNVFNLITLSPAVVPQGGAGGSQVGQNPFSWGNYQVGGSFGNQSAEYIDGQPVNIGYINLPILIPDQDAISEFKVQYNNLGPEWGRFSGAIVNLSTKGGTNKFHGLAYEYLRNKDLNSKPYFSSTNPPYVQNQFGGTVGGPIFRDKTFFFFAYDGYRQRASQVFTTTVPTVGERGGTFPSDTPIYDPLSISAACVGNTSAANCGRKQFTNNTIPQGTINPAALVELKFLPLPTNSAENSNFTSAAPSGGNTNQYVARVDHNLSSKQHIFTRYNFFNLLDLPTDPFGTGLCADRCAETYQTNAAVIGYSTSIRNNVLLSINLSGSRFHYLRSPKNSSFDLTQYGWPASYNAAIPSAGRSPFTPCFTPQDSTVTCSQGQSFITDHDTQWALSPNLTWIKGSHTIFFGGQLIETFDNYAQTNIASGAFAFDGSWTKSNPVSGGAGGTSFADFLLGYGLNQSSVFNHNFGETQIPALVAQKEVYRGFFAGDTWRATSKLTVNYGLRYDLQGPWSERHGWSSYWDPGAVNSSVTGCPGGSCRGDVFLVGNGVNKTRGNIPLRKNEVMPRLGVAYALDQKTVVRGGYGIFFIPNWIFFNANPSNDSINLASTLWVATSNGGITPNSTLSATNCAFTAGAPSGKLNCAANGPFGPNVVTPLGRGNVSAFDAGQNITVAPYTTYKAPYIQQFNLDIQREFPGGIFVDAAYAGSRGVHLPNPTATQVDQIPDAALSQGNALLVNVPNPFQGIGTVSSLNPATNKTVLAGQLLRPYPQYGGVSLAGDGCCSSDYSSLQVSVTKRFTGGASFLAAYTNEKLLTNADTLTTWLESGVGEVQDWNNLKGEWSLSSQDVSQRLVLSYIYDLPFGHGQKYLPDSGGVLGKAVSGWGLGGITTFQKGFPLPISYGGSTSLSQASLGIGTLRPNVVPGCSKGAAHVKQAGGIAWFNPACFTAPSSFGFGNESRVDPTLRGQGISNWDLAIKKSTGFGPEDKYGLEFRTEFFNTFNRVQFSSPNTACCSSNNGSFGITNNQLNNPRLIQFALKFQF